ncbi:MAG: HAMP domain-containing histidine kinase, partial [Rhizobiales bacterium]|nr:HAMP domain-containing histidine kinase [Hyphomicrobiales bacterium]
ATEAGASDFLDKSDLNANLMERSIRYAIANSKALEALEVQKSLLTTTIEYSGAGVAALDGNQTLTTCNQRFETLLNEYALVHFGDAQNAQSQALLHMIAGLADAERHEIEFTNASGQIFEVRTNPTPHGGMVIFAVDVSAQKAFEANLIKAKADVEAASRAKSSFLANMSHEFRTPLHGIMGFSDLIRQHIEDEEIKEFVQQISDSSVHLLEIINTVLAYSRLEAGQHPFDSRELLDIEHLIDFCVKQVLPKANERGISIRSNIDPQLVSLDCDTTSVRRILINLLSNAVRFSKEQSEVQLNLQIVGDGQLRMSVLDFGIGMKPEQVDKAFLPFHQLGSGYDRQSDGTGLGLPMVKSLAELHSAEVCIDTAPGQGTCVSVIFPAERVVRNQTIRQVV